MARLDRKRAPGKACKRESRWFVLALLAALRLGLLPSSTPAQTPANRPAAAPTATHALPAQAAPANPCDTSEHCYDSKIKQYLLVVSSESTVGELPIADTDPVIIKQMLDGSGYHPLVPPLIGKQATASSLRDMLAQISTMSDRHWIVIYYSGHAQALAQDHDLELELAGGDTMTVQYLLSKAVGPAFRGHLYLIIDACESGAALPSVTYALSPEQQQYVSVLTSSPADLNSYTFSPDGQNQKEESVFTYRLNYGVEKDWDRLDETEAGAVGLTDLDKYMNLPSAIAEFENKYPGIAIPRALVEEQAYQVLIYEPQKDRKPTLSRDELAASEIYSYEAASHQDLAVMQEAGSGALTPSDRTRELGGLIDQSDNRPYVQAARLLALGQYSGASQIFQGLYARGTNEPQRSYVALLEARCELDAGNAKGSAVWYDASRALSDPKDVQLAIEAGAAHARAGELPQAQQLLQYAYRTASSGPRSDTVLATAAANELAFTDLQAGNAAGGKNVLAVQSKLDAKAGDTLSAAVSKANLAAVYSQTSNLKAASKTYQQAVALFVQASGISATTMQSANFRITLQDYSKVLKGMGKNEKAVAIEKEAAALGSVSAR